MKLKLSMSIAMLLSTTPLWAQPIGMYQAANLSSKVDFTHCNNFIKEDAILSGFMTSSGNKVPIVDTNSAYIANYNKSISIDGEVTEIFEPKSNLSATQGVGVSPYLSFPKVIIKRKASGELASIQQDYSGAIPNYIAMKNAYGHGGFIKKKDEPRFSKTVTYNFDTKNNKCVPTEILNETIDDIDNSKSETTVTAGFNLNLCRDFELIKRENPDLAKCENIYKKLSSVFKQYATYYSGKDMELAGAEGFKAYKPNAFELIHGIMSVCSGPAKLISGGLGWSYYDMEPGSSIDPIVKDDSLWSKGSQADKLPVSTTDKSKAF